MAPRKPPRPTSKAFCMAIGQILIVVFGQAVSAHWREPGSGPSARSSFRPAFADRTWNARRFFPDFPATHKQKPADRLSTLLPGPANQPELDHDQLLHPEQATKCRERPDAEIPLVEHQRPPDQQAVTVDAHVDRNPLRPADAAHAYGDIERKLRYLAGQLP